MSSLYGEYKKDAELKKLQYEHLNSSDKSIIDNVKQLYALSEMLEKVNYENCFLRENNKKLTQENSELKKQMEQIQKSIVEHTNNSLNEFHL